MGNESCGILEKTKQDIARINQESRGILVSVKILRDPAGSWGILQDPAKIFNQGDVVFQVHFVRESLRLRL